MQSEAFCIIKFRFWMVALNMAPDQSCRGCGHENDCKYAFERLSRARGASVVWLVFAAFVLPMVFFIVMLFAFDIVMQGHLAAGKLLTLLVFLAATTCTLGLVLMMKVLGRRLRVSERRRYDF